MYSETPQNRNLSSLEGFLNKEARSKEKVELGPKAMLGIEGISV